MKNGIIAGLVAVIAIGGAVVFAQSQRTANIEVRVWEDVNDPERNYISARPEGGSWRALGTIPLPLTDGVSSSGRFRYGDITLVVPLPEQAAVPSATPTPSPTATPTPTPTPTPSSTVCEQADGSGGKPPAVFSGVARLDGHPAEQGTTVTAMVGKVCCATGSVRANGFYILFVPPSCGSGSTVTFTVGGVPAVETGVWRNSEMNRLDLSASRTTALRPAPAHAQFGDWRREEVRDNSHVDNPNQLTRIWYVLSHVEVDSIVAGAPESMALALGCSALSSPAPRFETESRGADGYQKIISTFPSTYPGGTTLYSRRLATELLTDSDRIITITVMSGAIEIAVFTFDVTGIDAVLDDLPCY